MTNYRSWVPSMPGYTADPQADFQDMRTPQDQIHWLYRAYKDIAGTYEEQINAALDNVAALAKEISAEYAEIERQVIALGEKVDRICHSSLVYDPTKGVYTGSIDAARRMVQVVGAPPKDYNTVDKVAALTVADLAKLKCGELINRNFADYEGIDIPEQEMGA